MITFVFSYKTPTMSAKSPWNTHTVLGVFHPHPIFAAEITIVNPLSPSYNVESIAEDLSYLERHHFSLQCYYYHLQTALLYGGGDFVVRLQHKRISWTEILTNEVVLGKVGSERQPLTIIRRRQWRFVGHELRREGVIEKNILEAEMTGKRARGRQRLKMLDWIMETFRVKDGEQLANVARDKKRWREREPPLSVYGIKCHDTIRRRLQHKSQEMFQDFWQTF